MLVRDLFPGTLREAPKDAESINHKLLVRAGFIDQLMAGSWTLLPLGWRVVTKIENIIREEINAVGGQELLMPLLHPKNIWNETGRWDKADEIMYKLKDSRKKEYALSFTHEEIVIDLLRKHLTSYQDFPVAVYHFSTKFRNELRAKSGILRGREFIMKDLYSVHTSEANLMEYYEKVKEAYTKIFNRLGFDFRVTEASGGVFTDKHTHEFQVLAESGEDIIYYCEKCDWGANKEVFGGKAGDKCPSCGGKVLESRAIEVGNIFPLGTWYSEAMNFRYTDENGNKQLVWYGSYGIGVSRVLGTLAEVNHDEKGLVWPHQVAPFDVHLVSLNKDGDADKIYETLSKNGVDVLYDNRPLGAGEKLSDADLIGIPVRLIVSEKTGDKVEYKKRSDRESSLLSLEEVVKKLR